MNVLHMLGLDSNEIYGAGLILIGIISFIFPYVRWRRNDAWKKNEGEKTRFTEIWRPSSLFGTITFLLLGLAFWFLGDILDLFRPQ
ncbi:MAG: hypothetical protein MJ175_11840 [Clostridia bacterium]|nr:hypothetical protein [Clostridia bacterium]